MSDSHDRRISSAFTDVVLAHEQLDQTLGRVAQLAVFELDGCDFASVTLMRDGKPATAVSTDLAAEQIDEVQYQTGAGPCLEAWHARQTIPIADVSTETRWPAFTAAAAAHGAASTLSLPLLVADEALGALNLYSRAVHGFSHEDIDHAALFAAHAAVLVANAQAYWASQTLNQQLRTAMASRAVIEQAKGIIIARDRCTADEAFAVLQAQSNATNVKLSTVATRIVAAAQRQPGSSTES